MARTKRSSSPFGNTITEQLRSLAVPIHEVALHPNNPRNGDVGALSESLRMFGQTKPIIVQKSTGYVIGGNHLLRAAVALGWSEIAANYVDVDDDVAQAIAIADNRIADLGSYDDEVLASILADLARKDLLAGTGYDGDDIDDLIRDAGTGPGEGPKEDGGELSATPWVKTGQIFKLGHHVVMCGDGRDVDVIRKLLGDIEPKMLLMTPPYEKDAPNRVQMEQVAVKYVDAFRYVEEQFWFGADAYRSDLPFGDSEGSWLVWDKRTDASDAQFGPSFELIWSKSPHKRDILRHQYTGVSDVEVKKRGDSTPRPSGLILEVMERWSGFESVVLSPFLDSGPTLTAAEKSGRVLYGAKASPAHVQSLLDRWQEYSGERPELLGEDRE
jgi:hypothetical protein